MAVFFRPPGIISGKIITLFKIGEVDRFDRIYCISNRSNNRTCTVGSNCVSI